MAGNQDRAAAVGRRRGDNADSPARRLGGGAADAARAGTGQVREYPLGRAHSVRRLSLLSADIARLRLVGGIVERAAATVRAGLGDRGCGIAGAHGAWALRRLRCARTHRGAALLREGSGGAVRRLRGCGAGAVCAALRRSGIGRYGGSAVGGARRGGTVAGVGRGAGRLDSGVSHGGRSHHPRYESRRGATVAAQCHLARYRSGGAGRALGVGALVAVDSVGDAAGMGSDSRMVGCRTDGAVVVAEAPAGAAGVGTGRRICYGRSTSDRPDSRGTQYRRRTHAVAALSGRCRGDTGCRGCVAAGCAAA